VSELSKQKESVFNSERQITELSTQIKSLKGEALNIQEQTEQDKKALQKRAKERERKI
jgi:hypothetical protein